MKKILLSLLTVSAVAAVAFAGTRAFFSDTETSTGNTFTAGAIDLTVSAHNWSANQDINVAQGFKDFVATDWNGNATFNFVDLKPGDMGGGYFDLNIVSNPAYACFSSEITATADNTVNEPETESGDVTPDLGELQNYLNIVYFEDKNADGKWDTGDGPKSAPVLLSTVTTTGWLALRDATPGLFDSVLTPGTPKNLGYMWCFGSFNADLTACDGVGDQNIAQTDSVTGSLKFYATQVRNNTDFTCKSMNPVFVLDEEESGLNLGYNEENQDNGWPYISWVINGDEITFTATNPTGITLGPFYFDYQVDGESGNPVPGVSGLNSPSGRLQGLAWGDFYNYLIVGPGETKSVTVQGNSDIRIRLRLGPERDYDFNWIVFKAE